MSREVRMVPPDWEHPKNGAGQYKPLFERDYKEAAAEWLKYANEKGLQEAIDWHGQAPDAEDYMPAWSESEATHYMMYECTSEGTPISPAFATPEELARWLTDNKASAFAGQTASYDAWLNVARGAYAVSAVLDSKGLRSGVEALTDNAK